MGTEIVKGVTYAAHNEVFWWTWPLRFMSDVFTKPTNSSVARGPGSILEMHIGLWQLFYRCPCGVGYVGYERTKAAGGTAEKANITGPYRWLCKDCGRAADTTREWIGRRVWEVWEWKPLSELPEDLRTRHAASAPSPVEDFDARVKAAVEVELAARQVCPCVRCEKLGRPGPCDCGGFHGVRISPVEPMKESA